MTMAHVPVLCAAVRDALAPADGERFVDGTFGGGGYTRMLLAAARTEVFAIDRDPDAIARGRALATDYPGRLTLIEGRFSEMDRLLAAYGVTAVDGIVLDVGVSSQQLDDPERGFSFQADGPLDMRMERRGESAADIVNRADESALADILRRYGEERQARRIARAIVAARRAGPIERTSQLADIVARTLGRPRPGGRTRTHPATRTFQALRILVNDELGELERALRAAERLLRPGGRLAVVCFHSLEDRIVKSFLAERAGRLPAPSRHLPAPAAPPRAPSFSLPRKGAIRPDEREIATNPRARSARLRVAIRTSAPAWEEM
ncbi:MAG: 16S rRNA (cytosine(1402)-N(4))-methyltransferase RsmH [Alphaproteobacteria bacterium]|nr:MAG: 16S rRNA (cytosine(1402)-N(4))-methyltransferase RsmH [Alphaproteobacteria bacterium]